MRRSSVRIRPEAPNKSIAMNKILLILFITTLSGCATVSENLRDNPDQVYETGMFTIYEW